ncbi:MAG: cellulase family glycosylhydrolase [Anaerolineales bacterium]
MHIEGNYFKDEFGRTLSLRGVNLGGSTKVPFSPNGATYLKEGYFDYRNVSFIGRPFPIQEADEHFARLKAWGLTFIRFLVTWEAIEHAGPGLYDRNYLEYIQAVVEKAAEYGIQMFIDPHQDVWSRFSGGDGAPGWTFELVGMDIKNFQATGAAFTHQLHGDPLPQMIWSTNATKLAAATMFTLFFGGRDFAPKTIINGDSAQEFLQRHYINSLKELALYLKDLPNVVGFDTMNEPVEGYIGIEDLNQRYTTIEKGFVPTPFQSMQLGCGIPLELEIWERGIWGPRVVGKQVLNPEGKGVWLEGFDPIWKANGVWEIAASGKPNLTHPDHFSNLNGRRVNFNRDYYIPFNNRFAIAIREIKPDHMIFIEKGFRSGGPVLGAGDAENIVYAPHWYDPVVLVMKSFNRWINFDRGKSKLLFGPGRIAKSFARQLARPKEHAQTKMGDVPTLIGEVGIAYDLDNKKAYHTGDFSAQINAFDRTLRALEENLHHFTLWNYTADNTNARGDMWNDEDLSIFSQDQRADPEDINSGGRALEAVIRPYPIAVAGEPLEIRFDIKRKIFKFRFRHDPVVKEPTEIFVPLYQYPNGCIVEISDGEYELNLAEQILTYWPSAEVKEHLIRLKLDQTTKSL